MATIPVMYLVIRPCPGWTPGALWVPPSYCSPGRHGTGSDWTTLWPPWIAAIATAGLLIGAAITVYFARKAFNAQSAQLADQLRVNKQQVEVLKLQQQELAGSLLIRQRAQANEVNFERYRPDAATIFTRPPSPRSPTVILVVENGSRRPIRNVSCLIRTPSGLPYAVGYMSPPDKADQRTRPRLFYPDFSAPAVPVIGAGERYGFLFDQELPADSSLLCAARFTDDANLNWEVDQYLHLALLDVPGGDSPAEAGDPEGRPDAAPD